MERKVTKFVICIGALLTEICFAGEIIKTTKLDDGRLVEATVDILESCYTDRFSTVGLAGPSVRSIMTQISLRKNHILVTLIDETSRKENHDPINRASRFKLPVFVITITDSNTLVNTLAQVQNTKWWNHMASVLLIGWPKIENGCSDAYDMLWEAWKMNLLNAKFVCLHRTRGRLIYTFNPYTSHAPIPWRQENTFDGIGGHIWTLYVREYHEGESCCDELDYDKTVNLGGYEIRASIKSNADWRYADADTKPTLITRVNKITAQILMSSLNATWKLTALEEYEAEADVNSGMYDILLNILIQEAYMKNETTYPLLESSIAILTQFRGNKSQLNKIISVLDIRSRFGVVVVLMITLLFFKCCLRKPLMPAILDLVLVTCNAALRKIPAKLAPRIYLGTLFIFVVTIQGIYQGKLASLLTKHVRLPDIDSIEDLARSDHTIYGFYPYRTFFNESAFKGRYVESTHEGCIDYVLRDPKAACVDARLRLTGEAAKHKLHLSRESLGTVYGVYLIRPDWPLQERVNVIFGRAEAGSIIKRQYSIESDSEINAVKLYENQEHEPTVKVLTLGNLGFAFVILGIGLGCALITFIIEVGIADLRSRIGRLIRLIK